MGTNLPPLCLMRYRGTQNFPDLWLKKKSGSGQYIQTFRTKIGPYPCLCTGSPCMAFYLLSYTKALQRGLRGASPNALCALNLQCGLNLVSAWRRGPLGLRGISCLPEGHFLSNWHRGLIFPSHPVLRMDHWEGRSESCWRNPPTVRERPPTCSAPQANKFFFLLNPVWMRVVTS